MFTIAATNAYPPAPALEHHVKTAKAIAVEGADGGGFPASPAAASAPVVPTARDYAKRIPITQRYGSFSALLPPQLMRRSSQCSESDSEVGGAAASEPEEAAREGGAEDLAGKKSRCAYRSTARMVRAVESAALLNLKTVAYGRASLALYAAAALAAKSKKIAAETGAVIARTTNDLDYTAGFRQDFGAPCAPDYRLNLREKQL